MDKEDFRKLLVQWASEDVYINQLTWEEGDALAEYLAKWYAAQQPRALDTDYCTCNPRKHGEFFMRGKMICIYCRRPCQ